MSLKFLRVLVIFILVNETYQLKIECRFEETNYVGVRNSIYGCKTSKITDVNEQKLEFVNGTHSFGKRNQDVIELFFVPCGGMEILKYFPSEILTFLPSLTKIVILIKNDISELSSIDLQPYKNLEKFFFSYSKIHSIPGDLFKYNTKLIHIWFNDNDLLESVGENFLENLKELKNVWLVKSKCIDRMADSPEEIEFLKEDLLINCPAKLEKYPIEVTNYIKVLRNKISQLQNENRSKSKAIKNLQKVAEEQRQIYLDTKNSEDYVQPKEQVEHGLCNFATLVRPYNVLIATFMMLLIRLSPGN